MADNVIDFCEAKKALRSGRKGGGGSDRHEHLVGADPAFGNFFGVFLMIIFIIWGWNQIADAIHRIDQTYEVNAEDDALWQLPN